MQELVVSLVSRYCWWFRNPANRLVVYPIIYSFFYIPGGCLGFLNPQQYHIIHSSVIDYFMEVWRSHWTFAKGMSSKHHVSGDFAVELPLFNIEMHGKTPPCVGFRVLASYSESRIENSVNLVTLLVVLGVHHPRIFCGPTARSAGEITNRSQGTRTLQKTETFIRLRSSKKHSEHKGIFHVLLPGHRSSWWLNQSIWKILVKLDHFPR